MAYIASAHEASVLNSVRGRPRIYPWNHWTDGRAWVVVKDEDFTIKPKHFSIQVHNHARTHGMKASTLVDGDRVIFRFSRGV